MLTNNATLKSLRPVLSLTTYRFPYTLCAADASNGAVDLTVTLAAPYVGETSASVTLPTS